MQKRQNGTALAAGLVVAACLGLGACSKAPPPAPAKGIPEVGVITVQTQELQVSSELPGRTSPYQIAEVRPQVGGIVEQRLFNEGGDVKAGEVLYLIAPASYRAAVDSARAAQAKAEATAMQARLKLDRYKELVAIKAVSQQDYDDANAAVKQTEADVAASRAALDTAQINLGYTRIVSPIAGRAGKSTVTPGALLTASQVTALTTVQQLDPIYVDVTQSSTELMRLRRALESGKIKRAGADKAKVKLLLDDGTAYALEGNLAFSDVTVDPGTGAVSLRAVFPNPRHELLPGMYVRAVLQQGVNEQGIAVPQQGVTRNSKGEATALVVGADGKVEQRILQTGEARADKWVVNAGLKVGDQLIVEGVQKAKPGTMVKAVPYVAPTAPLAAAKP